MSNDSKRQGNLIEKVEATRNPGWAKVTVRDKDGRSRVITVRRGSVFRNRPKPTSA